jgi:hypothetical protein
MSEYGESLSECLALGGIATDSTMRRRCVGAAICDWKWRLL